MTKMLGLRTAIYKVDNLDEAKKWYTKAFETEPYFDEPFYVGFSIKGYELGLLPEESKGKPPRRRNAPICYECPSACSHGARKRCCRFGVIHQPSGTPQHAG